MGIQVSALATFSSVLYLIFHAITFMRTYAIDLATNVCGFIVQLIEHGNGNAELMALNPIEALNFFQTSLQLLKLQTQLQRSFLHFTVSSLSMDHVVTHLS